VISPQKIGEKYYKLRVKVARGGRSYEVKLFAVTVTPNLEDVLKKVFPELPRSEDLQSKVRENYLQIKRVLHDHSGIYGLVDHLRSFLSD